MGRGAVPQSLWARLHASGAGGACHFLAGGKGTEGARARAGHPDTPVLTRPDGAPRTLAWPGVLTSSGS